jgi:hypothetical protein
VGVAGQAGSYSPPPIQGFYATNVLAYGPVGYWPLQETNAPAAVTMETNYGTLGELGNAYYAATNVNNVTFNQAGALTASGDNDTAVLFTGDSLTSQTITNIDSYAFVPRRTPALTLRPPLSLECWVNSSFTTFGDMFGEGGGTGLNAPSGAGNYGGIRMSWSGAASGASLSLYVANGNGTTRNSVSTPANSISLGRWHHLLATYDGTNTVLYVDGAQLARDSTTLAGANTMAPDLWSPFTMGGSFWQNIGPARAFNGCLDEIAVYTNVLSALQVTNHYLAGITSGSNYMPTVLGDQPLLYYRMDCAGYTNPATVLPVAFNYGSSPVYGFYSPGTVPAGVFGPPILELGTNTAASPINGVISCVDAGYDPAFNPVGTQPFTAMIWFRTYLSDGRTQAIMSHGSLASWGMNLMGTNGTLAWNSGAGSVVSTNLLNDGNWHFAAGVYDGTKNYLYVDGALNNSAPVSGSVAGNTTDHLFLGGDPDYTTVGSGQRYFAGAIAQAAFYTNLLTLPQIQQLYTIANTPVVSLSRNSGSQLVITYTGTLLSSTNAAGPYMIVTGATSPYVIPATNQQQFYRSANIVNH